MKLHDYFRMVFNVKCWAANWLIFPCGEVNTRRVYFQWPVKFYAATKHLKKTSSQARRSGLKWGSFSQSKSQSVGHSNPGNSLWYWANIPLSVCPFGTQKISPGKALWLTRNTPLQMLSCVLKTLSGT